jgi:hypothetical protein
LANIIQKESAGKVPSSSPNAARKLGTKRSPYTIVEMMNVDLLKFFIVVWGRPKVAHNDLHASDGRDTEALNCKPITNL